MNYCEKLLLLWTTRKLCSIHLCVYGFVNNRHSRRWYCKNASVNSRNEMSWTNRMNVNFITKLHSSWRFYSCWVGNTVTALPLHVVCWVCSQNRWNWNTHRRIVSHYNFANLVVTDLMCIKASRWHCLTRLCVYIQSNESPFVFANSNNTNEQ